MCGWVVSPQLTDALGQDSMPQVWHCPGGLPAASACMSRIAIQPQRREKKWSHNLLVERPWVSHQLPCVSLFFTCKRALKIKPTSQVVGRTNGINARKHLAQCLTCKENQNAEEEGGRKERSFKPKLIIMYSWLSSFSLYLSVPICQCVDFQKVLTTQVLHVQTSKSL